MGGASWWMAVLACTLAVLARPRIALAAPITWDAPPGCPDEAELRAQLREAIADEASLARLGDVHARVRPTAEGRWELVVTFSASPDAERRLVLDACDEAPRVTAFIVAITLDPNAGLAAPEPAEIPQPPAPALPAEPNEPAPTRAPEPIPALPVLEEPAADAPAFVPRSRARPRVLLDAGGAVQIGVFPTVTAGAIAATGLAWPRARLVLGYARWFPSRATLPSRSDAGARVSVHAFTADAGPVLRWRTIELPFRAGLELGALRAQGFGTDDDRSPTQVWLAFTAGGGIVWLPRALGGYGGLALQADLVVPALRPTVVIDRTQEVFEIGAIGLRAGLRLEARFP